MFDRAEKIKNLWNQAITDYDLHMQKTGHYSAQEKLLNELKNYFESPIIDLATGPGFLAEKLLIKEHQVILNDFSDQMFKSFSKKFSTNINAVFLNQDAQSINLKESFKTIICCNLFYYLENRDVAIQNWKNLLKSSGLIILFEEYPFHRPNTEEMKNHERELMDMIQPLSPNEIIKIFAKNNFRLLDKKNVSIDQNHDLYGFIFDFL